MLNIEQLNQYYGQSHTLWGESGPFARWADAARRTPGRDAGLDSSHTDVSCATVESGTTLC
jgi:hypothetical protein